MDTDSTLLSKLEVGNRVPTVPQAEALGRYYESLRRRCAAAFSRPASFMTMAATLSFQTHFRSCARRQGRTNASHQAQETLSRTGRASENLDPTQHTRTNDEQESQDRLGLREKSVGRNSDRIILTTASLETRHTPNLRLR
jgi:hypothetical protein